MREGTAGQQRGRALVLGEDTRAFLAVVRSLGRAGVEVHAGWGAADTPASRSRYLVRRQALPAPWEDEVGWLPALLGLLREVHYDLILPCRDQDLMALRPYREEIEVLAKIAMPDEPSLSVFMDKIKTWELAQRVNVPVPRQLVVTDCSGAKQVRSDFRLPVVLKPPSSVETSTYDRRTVQKAQTWEEFDQLITEMLKLGPVAVQENLTGDGIGVEMLLEHGEPLLTFQHRRVHEPPHGGGSSYRRGEEVSPVLLAASRALFAGGTYTGVAMVEFKGDPDAGAWGLMEVNPRFWGSLPLAIASGADFPAALYRLLVYGQRPAPTPPRAGLYGRNLAADLGWIRTVLRDRRTLAAATRQTVANVSRGVERSDTLVRDDPGPGIAEVQLLAGKAADRVWGRPTLLAGRMRPLRRLLQRRAQRDLRRARHVLFVCHGNILRSPFAARLATQLAPGKEYCSAGSYPTAGRPTPAPGLEAAAQFGVDLASHRSTVLDDELIQWADVIFVFDRRNLVSIRQAARRMGRPVHFLGALTESGPTALRDPYGEDAGGVARVYAQIRAAFCAGFDRRPASEGHTSDD